MSCYWAHHYFKLTSIVEITKITVNTTYIYIERRPVILSDYTLCETVTFCVQGPDRLSIRSWLWGTVCTEPLVPGDRRSGVPPNLTPQTVGRHS